MKTLFSCLILFCVWSAAAAQPSPAPPAQAFQFSPDFPKYVTCDLEFRDPSEEKWPNFFYGKPQAPGFINLAQRQASFAFDCDKMVQRNGDQSRRVLGELCQGGKTPVVSVAVTSMQLSSPDAGFTGKDKKGVSATLSGTMDVDGRKVPIQAVALLRYHEGKGDEKNTSLMGEARCEVKPSSLGLKNFKSDDALRVRFSFTAYAQGGPAALTPASK